MRPVGRVIGHHYTAVPVPRLGRREGEAKRAAGFDWQRMFTVIGLGKIAGSLNVQDDQWRCAPVRNLAPLRRAGCVHSLCAEINGRIFEVCDRTNFWATTRLQTQRREGCLLEVEAV